MTTELDNEALRWIIGNYYPEDIPLLKEMGRLELVRLFESIVNDAKHEPIKGKVEA
jgi:hypothetical protein